MLCKVTHCVGFVLANSWEMAWNFFGNLHSTLQYLNTALATCITVPLPTLKTMVNFSPAERPHCKVMLLTRHNLAALKSEVRSDIALTVKVYIVLFKELSILQRWRLHIALFIHIYMYVHCSYSDRSLIPMPPTAWPGYEAAQAKPHLLRVVMFPRMTSSRRLIHFSCAPTSLSITIGRTPSNHNLRRTENIIS